MKKLTFELRSAWKRTGCHNYTETRFGSDFVDPQKLSANRCPNFALVLIWAEAGREYLDIRASYRAANSSSLDEQDFNSDPRLLPGAQLEGQRLLMAPLSHDHEVTVHVTIDTDHPSFLARNRENDRQGFVEEVRVDAYPQAREAGRPSSMCLRLKIDPACEMLPFPGCVALDLGNTNSAVVCLGADQNHAVVGVEKGPHGDFRPGPVASALRIIERLAVDATDVGLVEVVEEENDDSEAVELIEVDEADALDVSPGPEPATREFSCCDYVIGKNALAVAEGGWLILGAKRLLRDAAAANGNTASEDTIQIYIDDEPIDIPRREPAELFVAEVLRRFHNQKRGFPQPIVITCPVTFSEYEIHQLRIAVFQAWRRARGLPDGDFDPQQVSSLVKQVIDEASAAGFYFLFRDFIDAPGRVPGFRYLYPQGMYLLLYDCGGGTTDISLIRAGADDARHLSIEVLGRTGHRNFGGDAITTAVFHLLRAKIASLLGGPALPDSPQDIAYVLRNIERLQAINSLVPTHFDEGPTRSRAPRDAGVRRRMITRLLLWQWAETIKHELSDRGEDEQSPRLPTLSLSEHQQLAALLNLSKSSESDWQRVGLGELISITLAEVHALVDDDILETIRYANHLLRARLPDGAEVESVYVVGNASRFPRIKQLLRDPIEGLQVRFLDERMPDVAHQDLKNSVAMGAVRALQLSEQLLGIDVEFDKRFMERLPFSVVYTDLAEVEDTLLFREHELFEELTPKMIAIPDGQATHCVPIGRKWPGDVEVAPFLEFHFPDSVSGVLVLSYDQQNKNFVMHLSGAPQIFTIGRPAVAPWRTDRRRNAIENDPRFRRLWRAKPDTFGSMHDDSA